MQRGSKGGSHHGGLIYLLSIYAESSLPNTKFVGFGCFVVFGFWFCFFFFLIRTVSVQRPGTNVLICVLPSSFVDLTCRLQE